MKTNKRILAFILTGLLFAFTTTGCGVSDNVQSEKAFLQLEPGFSDEEWSNTCEEWLNSLEIEEPTLIILDKPEGIMKVLDTQKTYTVSQDDILIYWKPAGWMHVSKPDEIFNSTQREMTTDGDSRYRSLQFFYGMFQNYDSMKKKETLTWESVDPNGNDFSITLNTKK